MVPGLLPGQVTKLVAPGDAGGRVCTAPKAYPEALQKRGFERHTYPSAAQTSSTTFKES